MYTTAQEGLPAYRRAITAYVAFIADLKERYSTGFHPLLIDPPDLGKLYDLNGRVRGMEEALGLTEAEADEIGTPLGMESYADYKARKAKEDMDPNAMCTCGVNYSRHTDSAVDEGSACCGFTPKT